MGKKQDKTAKVKGNGGDASFKRKMALAMACAEMAGALAGSDFTQVAGLLCFEDSASVSVFTLLLVLLKDGVALEPREVDWDDEDKSWAGLPVVVRTGLAEGHAAAKSFFAAMLALIDVLPDAAPRLPRWISAVEETIRPNSAEDARKLMNLVQVKSMGPRARSAWVTSLGRLLAEADRLEIEAAASPDISNEKGPSKPPRL